MTRAALAVAAFVSLVLLVALFAASRRRRLLPASLGTLLALATAWAAAALAYAADYRDADGAIDCWPGCSALQQAVFASLFWGPAVAVVVVAGTIVGYAVRR